MIIDMDVHHGNGTQEAFYDDPSVLFFSSHQADIYPATGAAGDTGADAGEGFTVNLPVPGGTGDAPLVDAYRHLVLPLADRFRPDLVLVSAGYDAHRLDPLGGLALSVTADRPGPHRARGRRRARRGAPRAHPRRRLRRGRAGLLGRLFAASAARSVRRAQRPVRAEPPRQPRPRTAHRERPRAARAVAPAARSASGGSPEDHGADGSVFPARRPAFCCDYWNALTSLCASRITPSAPMSLLLRIGSSSSSSPSLPVSTRTRRRCTSPAWLQSLLRPNRPAPSRPATRRCSPGNTSTRTTCSYGTASGSASSFSRPISIPTSSSGARPAHRRRRRFAEGQLLALQVDPGSRGVGEVDHRGDDLRSR